MSDRVSALADVRVGLPATTEACDHQDYITPCWPAPPAVRAYTTTRHGGVSQPPWDSFNLAYRVGDDAKAVAENRRLLAQALRLPQDPCWLNQVHGTTIIDAATVASGYPADGCIADGSDRVCAVLTADCIPLLLCDRLGTCVAAVHAGWRGLAAGVIESAVLALERPGKDLFAWLGPAIGPHCFEVGHEVRKIFLTSDQHAAMAFAPSPAGRWFADLYRLARQRLEKLGVHAVYGGEYCTHTDPKRFFSFRRDRVTGRMASLIWIDGGR